MNLNELLVCSGQGDAKAFQRLYELSAPHLLAVCRRVLKQPELAEEVLQESFIKIWYAAQHFSSSRAQAMTWMTSIVRHQAIDRLRSQPLRHAELNVEWTDDLGLFSLEPSPEQLQELSEQGQRLQFCLEHLSLPQRQCLLAAYYEGKTHQELAYSLRKPLGTVKAWIRRGLEQLRGCLQ
jgi:RNA polymerase sigma-70 factor (ECF subfamily)